MAKKRRSKTPNPLSVKFVPPTNESSLNWSHRVSSEFREYIDRSVEFYRDGELPDVVTYTAFHLFLKQSAQLHFKSDLALIPQRDTVAKWLKNRLGK